MRRDGGGQTSRHCAGPVLDLPRARFNDATLAVRVDGRTIADVLGLSPRGWFVRQAAVSGAWPLPHPGLSRPPRRCVSRAPPPHDSTHQAAEGCRAPKGTIPRNGGADRTCCESGSAPRWPDSDRKRCTVHVLRNLVAKLPKQDAELRQRVEAAYWAALDDATSPADGEARLRRLVTDLERSYPSAAACLADDLPALCVHLAYPLRPRKRLRSTNLLERSLQEVKRRTKVIGRFPGETSCLSLCWAVLDLFIASARGLALTALEHRQLAQMRRRPPDPDAGVAVRIRCHPPRGCAVTFPADAGRDQGREQPAQSGLACLVLGGHSGRSRIV
jgi:Transposase, Mutator family